jgi:hypothetical protein
MKVSDVGTNTHKAGLFIMVGVIMAIIFGSILLISTALNDNADEWRTYERGLVTDLFDDGEITAEERDQRYDQIDDMRDWMEIQDFYVYLFAPLFINLGLIFITIGFIGFGINNSLEERTRRASILIAAAIIFIVLVLQSVGLSITIT